MCLIVLAIMACRQWLLSGMAERDSRLAALVRGQEKTARLFRFFERKHYPISVYDDVDMGEIDVPVYFVEVPVGSGKMRELRGSDFSLIDQSALRDGYKEEGRGSCPVCRYRRTDIPFMNVTIRSSALNGEQLMTIAGFERANYTSLEWDFAFAVFGFTCYYSYLGLLLLWHFHLGALVAAFVGAPPSDDWSLLFRNFAQLLDLEESRGLVFLNILGLPFWVIALVIFQMM
jgi:hypothetical protein